LYKYGHMKVRLLLESEDIPLEFADSPVICQVWFPFLKR